MSEQALRDQIAQLTAKLEAFEGSVTRNVAWNPEDGIQIVPEPATTVPLHTLIRIEGLPDDARAFRQLLEAVSLCHNLPAPTKDVPRTWVPVLKEVYSARSQGKPWADALGRAGLIPPPNPRAHFETMRAELDELYNRIPELVAHVNQRAASSVVRQRLLQQLGQLLM